MLQGVEAELKRDVRRRAARRAQHLLSLLDAAFDLEADGGGTPSRPDVLGTKIAFSCFCAKRLA